MPPGEDKHRLLEAWRMADRAATEARRVAEAAQAAADTANEAARLTKAALEAADVEVDDARDAYNVRDDVGSAADEAVLTSMDAEGDGGQVYGG